jgi:hypothetical protein
MPQLAFIFISGDSYRMSKVLYIVIGCDCDPDRPRFGGTRIDQRLSPHKWRGVSEGIPCLKKLCEKVKDRMGHAPKYTWCVRCDQQIKQIYGSPSWVLSEFLDRWNDLEGQGDEVGWHLHLWRWHEARNCWRQEISDENWICKNMEEGYQSFRKAWGKPPTCLRTGWTFHSNLTMNKANELGITVDFSALPGFSSSLSPDSKRFENYVDWEVTPAFPYHPSSKDYRRPTLNEKESLNLIEIPCSVLESALLSFLDNTVRAFKYKTLSAFKGKIKTFAPLISFNPIVFKGLIERNVLALKTSVKLRHFLVTYFHPDEISLSRRAGLYRLENSGGHIKRNLEELVRACMRHKIDMEFVTAGELGRLLEGPQTREEFLWELK